MVAKKEQFRKLCTRHRLLMFFALLQKAQVLGIVRCKSHGEEGPESCLALKASQFPKV